MDATSDALPARPTYAAAFRCIGAECEDHCCQGWPIPLDQVTYEQYRQFPREKLGSVVQQYVRITEAGAPKSFYAQIQPLPTGVCPFFAADRLCSIQEGYGPKLLSSTCSIYPRVLNRVDARLEGALSLSCPEAARNVLLHPGSMQVQGDLLSGDFRTDNSFQPAGGEPGSIHKPLRFFLPIRALLVKVIRDRSRPLWQRLLLLGAVCARLDEIDSPEADEAVPDILASFGGLVGSLEPGASDTRRQGALSAEFEAMPAHLHLRLDVILQLCHDCLRNPTCGQRFRETFASFAGGFTSLDNGTSLDPARFLLAEQTWYRPFFERFPFILENYLLNYMFQNLFPFGQKGSDRFPALRIFDEYLGMTTRFAWLNALLMGVAGNRREAFGEADLVITVQSFTRAIEHVPHIPVVIQQTLQARQLDNLEGMAVLLRS